MSHCTEYSTQLIVNTESTENATLSNKILQRENAIQYKTQYKKNI